MMVEQFIDRLEQQGLLDKNIVADLRRKVAKVKGKKVTPEAIAKFLVDKGHLTRFQATKVVNDVVAMQESAATSEPDVKPDADELGLAADGRDDAAAAASKEPIKKKKPAKPKLPDDDEVEDLTALGQEEPAEPKPTPKPAPEMPVAAKKPPPVPKSSAPTAPPVRDASDPLGRDLVTDLETSAPVSKHPTTRQKLRSTSEWDSVLLLVGGASLGVLLVLGGFLYLSLTRGAAEDLFAAAEESYGDEAYSTAIQRYDKYLDAYPNHEKAGMARVRREMARLRQVYKDPERGLKVAKEILPKIEKEEEFPEARAELASMLPQIAKGFVDDAMLEPDPAKQQALIEKTQEAMLLVDNSSYIPTTLRKSQLTTIATIKEDMDRVQRMINEERRLVETVQAITGAVEAGDTQVAYDARQALLKDYPGLKTNEELRQAVLKISEKERERVSVVNQPLEANNEQLPLAGESRVILSNQIGEAVPGVDGFVVPVLAGGSVFGIDVATGSVLWRRFVGYETTAQPSALSYKVAGSDVIAVDRRRQEVMRLAAKTGEPVWRLSVGEPFAEPVISDDRIYVAAQSGKLYVVNPETGVAERHTQIPQPLEIGPGIGSNRPHIYQLGNHDNLYALSTETLECAEVFYIGHEKGTIDVPPVMALGYLFVVVNNAGADSCDVHIISTDENGLKLKPAQRLLTLRGRVLVPPIVGRRRVLIVTDRRAVELFDVDPNNESGTPVTSAGRHNATNEEAITSYSLLQSGYMWVANNRFTKYQVQASTGKLPSEWVQDVKDVYVAPLRLVRDDAVIHVRRRQGAEGFTVAATRVSDKDPTWQTEICAPIRQTQVQGDKISAVTSRGRLFELAADNLSSGRIGKASAEATRDERLVMSVADGISMGNGETAFAAEKGYNQVVFHTPGGGNGGLRILTLTVRPGDATTPPTSFGGGLLVPDRTGLVSLVDTTTGANRAKPFHPDIQAGGSTEWNAPAVLDGGKEFVIADNHKRIFRVGIKDKPVPQLAELVGVDLRSDIAGPLATVGNAVYGVTRSGGGDSVLYFTLPGLEMAKEIPLTGRVLWGPQRVGDVVLLGTDTELVCLDGGPEPRWKVPLEHAPVVGRPLVADGQILLTSGDGFVLRVDAASGKTLATVEVGEPLDSGPVPYGDKLLVAGKNGTLFVIANPSP